MPAVAFTRYQATVLRCGHSFCQICLDEAINVDDRCPECRRPTFGILIPNLRLNECIHHFVKDDASKMNDFHRRKAHNADVMAHRRKNRAVLFAILHRSRRPLTTREIEEQWTAAQNLDILSDDIRTELHRMIRDTSSVFQIIVENNEQRVMLKNLGILGG